MCGGRLTTSTQINVINVNTHSFFIVTSNVLFLDADSGTNDRYVESHCWPAHKLRQPHCDELYINTPFFTVTFPSDADRGSDDRYVEGDC